MIAQISDGDMSAPHHLKALLAKLHNYDLLGSGMVSWQVQIAMVLMLISCAMSVGAFIDSNDVRAPPPPAPPRVCQVVPHGV